jgi:hypothetical protein
MRPIPSQRARRTRRRVVQRLWAPRGSGYPSEGNAAYRVARPLAPPAKTLGLTVPPSRLARADEVIE